MRKTTAAVAVAVSLLVAAPGAAAARSLKWSGYTWSVRTGTGGPGIGNIWSDRNAVVKRGNLLLSIVRRGAVWTSVELASARTFGFGRYRWVVNSNLATASAASVFALFTYSPQMAPSYGEQDFEFTRAWSVTPALWPGWVVSWHAANDRSYGNFKVPATPPYTATLTWLKGSITFRLVGRRGHLIARKSVKTSLSPRKLRVHLNYWVANPVLIAARGAAPRISIRSFSYTPAGRL